MQMLRKFCNDCDGGVITTELVLVTSVVVAGLLTGLGSFRNGVEAELIELSQKMSDFDRVGASVEIPAQELAQPQPLSTEFHAADLKSFLDN